MTIVTPCIEKYDFYGFQPEGLVVKRNMIHSFVNEMDILFP